MDKEEFIKKMMIHKDTVFRTALAYTKNKTDAEDISQEVFLKLYTSERTFSDREQEKAWLLRLTINKCKDLLKSYWFTRRSDETDIKTEYPVDREQSELLEKVMSLPDKYRIVLHLYYYEEYSVSEIAALTNSKVSTVQTRLQRGREKLKKKLAEKEEDIYEKGNLQLGMGQYHHE